MPLGLKCGFNANVSQSVCISSTYLILCVLQHGEPPSPAASTLAMVLTRGLSMEQQKSSRDSLQYSSGYSTQTNTPSCSEDTIPSQGKPLPEKPNTLWARRFYVFHSANNAPRIDWVLVNLTAWSAFSTLHFCTLYHFKTGKNICIFGGNFTWLLYEVKGKRGLSSFIFYFFVEMWKVWKSYV